MPVITHDFQAVDKDGGTDWPATSSAVKCLYCGRTADKTASEHCVSRELKECGAIPMRFFNPKGVERFDGRPCMTCKGNIMDHWILYGKSDWFCDRNGRQASEGMA